MHPLTVWSLFFAQIVSWRFHPGRKNSPPLCVRGGIDEELLRVDALTADRMLAFYMDRVEYLSRREAK